MEFAYLFMAIHCVCFLRKKEFYLLRLVQFSEKIDHNFLCPNFFDRSVPSSGFSCLFFFKFWQHFEMCAGFWCVLGTARDTYASRDWQWRWLTFPSHKGPFIYYIIAVRRGLSNLLQYYIGGGLTDLLQYYIGVGRPIEMFFIWMISEEEKIK